MERLRTDELTGAYQRGGLADLLEDLAEENSRTGAHYALAMIDVDHLKTLNDVYGHATGDAALQAVAERARRVLRPEDLLFRYGGDEFLLVLPGASRESAEAVARRVRDAVVANPVQAAVWVNVNVSIGVAASDEPGSSGRSDELFERADQRLYLAKRVGRNTVVAGDTPLKSAADGPLRRTRMIGRDDALAQVDAFLAAAVTTTEERVLRVAGPKGVGFTRFLSEVEVRASIGGKVVRRVEAVAADTGVYLRALAQPYGELLPPDPTEEEVAERLANDAAAHGLVVLLEGGRWLDAGSRILLANRLKRGGARLVEVVEEGTQGAFHPGATVELTPLAAQQVGGWLAAAVGAPIGAPTLKALVEATGGLPARLARLVDRLVRELSADGAALGAAQLANASPDLVRRLAGVERVAEAEVDLPQWDSPLLGRGQWLETTLNTLRVARLGVLVGPGGVGKTRLAAQLALELAPEAPGGTYWIDLRAVRDAALVPGLIAERLQLEACESVADVAAQLSPEPTLLVFDELDGVADQVGWVSALLEAAPQLRILGTSRMPLHLVGELDVSVPDLSHSAAVELFRRRMHRLEEEQERLEDDDDRIAELINRIGASPLVVELASAWTGALSVAELNERLARRPELLTDAPGVAPLTTRFIDVTRDLMSVDEREALGVLATVPAGFTADIARSAAGASPFFLLALLERSLIRREGERFTVHAAIAERYRASLADKGAARLQVARAFSEMASQIEAMDGQERNTRGYRQMDRERANLFFAVRELTAAGSHGQVWPLVRVLRGYLDVRGQAREGARLFQELLSMLPGSAEPELLGWVGECVALFKLHLGELDDALTRLREVLDRLAERPPSLTAGLAWNTMGMIHAYRDEPNEALMSFEVSASMRADLGDKVGEAQARGNMAIVLQQMDRPDQALAALEAAAERFREVKHASGVAVTLFSLASLGRESGLLSVDQRNGWAREALEVAEGMGYTTVARDAAGELATGLEDAGLLADAEAALERGLEWARVSEDEKVERKFQQRLDSLRSRREERSRLTASRTAQVSEPPRPN